MNWYQQLIKACTEIDGTPHPHTDHVLTGAKWQRDQMRTNEPVERMAKALYEQSSAYKWNGLEWADMHEDNREGIRESAKTAVNALLGEG